MGGIVSVRRARADVLSESHVKWWMCMWAHLTNEERPPMSSVPETETGRDWRVEQQGPGGRP